MLDTKNQTIAKLITGVKGKLGQTNNVLKVQKSKRCSTTMGSSNDGNVFLEEDPHHGSEDNEWGELAGHIDNVPLSPNEQLSIKKRDSLHPARPSLIKLDDHMNPSRSLQNLSDLLKTSSELYQNVPKKKRSSDKDKLEQKMSLSR